MKPKLRPLIALLALLIAVLMLAAIPVTAGDGQGQSGGISGQVTNIVGTGLGNVEVSLWQEFPTHGWQSIDFRTSDSEGDFNFTALAPGQYRILLTDPSRLYAYEYYDDAGTIETATPLTVTASNLVISPTLDLAGRISGSVTGDGGQPVQYGLVFAFDAAPTRGNVVSLANIVGGQYDLGGLRTGNYIVQFSGQVGGTYYNEYYDGVYEFTEGTPISVSLGFTTPGIDAVLGDDQNGAVAGLVRNEAGQPLAGIQTVLYRLTGSEWDVAEVADTAGDGTYQFSSLQSGTYRLGLVDYSGVHAFEFYDDATTLEAATDIVIANAPVVLPDIILSTAGRIQGQLVDPSGRPLDNPLVFVFTATPERGNPLYVANAAGGTYDIGGLATGNYILQFTGSQGNRHYVEYFDDASEYESATPIPVVAGQATTAVDGILGIGAGGTIFGEVVDVYGRAFDFTRVTAFREESGQWVPVGTGEAPFYQESYALDLAAGVYRLRFEAGSFAAPDYPVVEYYDDVTSVSAAGDLPLAVGDIIPGIDAILGNYAVGTISGRVTNLSGDALPGMLVFVYNRALRPLYDQTAVTDADGRYTLERLYPDEHFVEFFDPDYFYAGSFYDGAPTNVGATRVLYTDTPVSDIDATLSPLPPGNSLGSIAGTLSGSDGTPAFGIRIVAEDSDGEWAGVSYSDSDGNYLLRNLELGPYFLRFTSTGGDYVDEWYDNVPSRDLARPVTVTASSTVAGIDAVLQEAGRIQGTVLDPFGNDFQYLVVTPFRQENGSWTPQRARAFLDAGAYEIGGLTPDVYRIAFSGGSYTNLESEFYDDAASIESATDITVTAGALIDGIDAIIGQGPPGGIGGVVRDGVGQPLQGIVVTLYDESFFQANRETTTNAAGVYTLTLVYDGVYYVGFSDPQGVYPSEFYDDVASVQQATPLAVDGALIDGIDAVLDGAGGPPGGAQITGTVTLDGGGPLAGIEVRCYDGDGFYLSNCETMTDGDGRYTLGGYLPAGDYTVRFEDPAGLHVGEWYDDALTAAGAISLTLALGETAANIDAALAPAGAISGTVTRPNGQPWSLLTVGAFVEVNGEWLYINAVSGYEMSDYALAGLPVGDVRVVFSGRNLYGGGATIEYYDDAATLADADDVPIVAGQTTAGIDAVLGAVQPGGIEGQLVSTIGSPLSAIVVTLYDDAGFYVGQTTSANDGGYAFTNLYDGTYRVCFSDPLGTYRSECFDDAGDVADATPIVVGDALVTGIDATLVRPGGISGRVTDLQDDPLDFVEITLFEADGNGGWTAVAVTYADPAGNYGVGGLVPGDVRVQFVGYRLVNGGPPQMFHEVFDNASTLAEGNPVPIPEGGNAGGIDAQLGDLPPPPGSITGRVLSSDGASLPGIAVSLFWQDGAGRWWTLGSVASDSTGRYGFSGLVTGQFRVCFDDPTGNHESSCFDGRGHFNLATTVVVGQTSVNGIDGWLTPLYEADLIYLPSVATP